MELTARKQLWEDKTHGSIGFPVSMYPVVITQHQILPCHWHDEYEFFYLLEGHSMLRLDDEWVRLEPGDASLIKGGQLHVGFSGDGNPCTYCAVVFNPYFLSDGMDECGMFLSGVETGRYLLPNTFRNGNGWEGALLKELASIAEAFRRLEVGYQMDVKGRLLACLSLIYAHGCVEKERRGASKRAQSMAVVKTLMSFIHQNYQNKLGLEEFSDVTGESSYQLCRIFKRYTSHTTIEYLNVHRIERACMRFVEDPEMKVMDVAFDCGFENLSYFVRMFKRHKGCTPSEYRRRCQGEDARDGCPQVSRIMC